VLAYDFPLLSMFWVIFVVFVFMEFLFAVVWTFIDNFRRSDHNGWAKAGWMILILALPVIGVLAYVIARPAEPEGLARASDVDMSALA
jgi:quinol-cytochrome oxidoreductase complex cytochrome b subunit